MDGHKHFLPLQIDTHKTADFGPDSYANALLTVDKFSEDSIGSAVHQLRQFANLSELLKKDYSDPAHAF